MVMASRASADPCSDLLTNPVLAALPDTTITSAATVPAGTFVPPDGSAPQMNLPSFCRVTATLAPSAVSNIKLEVWMPISGWNGRLQGVGGGGLAGVIVYSALAPAIRAGYASVSTDTGHVSSDTTWLSSVDKEMDYGFRGIHGMTITAKAAIAQFYGTPAARSYFNGCSTGGGQGFGEVQLYPDDYDGAVTGAPQDFPTHLRAAEIYEYQVGSNDPTGMLPNATLSLVTKGVLAQCGSSDEISDGFLNNPQACTFNPKSIVCRPAQDPTTCITIRQALTVWQIYQGPRNPRTGYSVWPGLVRGSEQPGGPGLTGWAAAGINGPPFATASPFYRLGVFQNPNFDLRRMNMDSDVQLADTTFPFINHIDPNIDAFTRGRNSKLLIYHGWADPLISPQNTINYFGSIVAGVNARYYGNANFSAALQDTQQWVRLFMVPGMGHCSGGPGPDQFDVLNPLVQWVEQGVAPSSIIASHVTNGMTTYTRPLCAYPQVAQYSGSGDRTNAANWSCVDSSGVYDFDFYSRGMDIY
jgi:feruloyl esterase